MKHPSQTVLRQCSTAPPRLQTCTFPSSHQSLPWSSRWSAGDDQEGHSVPVFRIAWIFYISPGSSQRKFLPYRGKSPKNLGLPHQTLHSSLKLPLEFCRIMGSKEMSSEFFRHCPERVTRTFLFKPTPQGSSQPAKGDPWGSVWSVKRNSSLKCSWNYPKSFAGVSWNFPCEVPSRFTVSDAFLAGRQNNMPLLRWKRCSQNIWANFQHQKAQNENLFNRRHVWGLGFKFKPLLQLSLCSTPFWTGTVQWRIVCDNCVSAKTGKAGPIQKTEKMQDMKQWNVDKLAKPKQSRGCLFV